MQIPNATLHELAALDTCTVADAIECFDLRLRNEGYSNLDYLHCHFPDMTPVVGYAVTLRVRSGDPPMTGGDYIERTDWWNEFDHVPTPHVLVIEDVDERPGTGAFIDPVHGAILKAMGCVGVVTNGAVRGLNTIRSNGLQLYSRSLSPSHGYVHVVSFGTPVTVAGLRVNAGDLLHGDRHGIVRIPAHAAQEIPRLAAQIRTRESDIIAFCGSQNFSRTALAKRLRERGC